MRFVPVCRWQSVASPLPAGLCFGTIATVSPPKGGLRSGSLERDLIFEVSETSGWSALSQINAPFSPETKFINKIRKKEKAMQTPVQLDFQGMDARQDLRSAIARHLQQLEERFGRVTAGRVVLKAPSGHHRTGGLYEVNIRLSLPEGREVNIARTRHADERHADLNFAINDAFKRARRQLQDRAQRLQGKVKTHESPPIATVAEIDPSGEFGFLETTDGREVYFHRNSVLNGGFDGLEVGSRVTFAESAGDKGPQASTVRPMGKHTMKV
jgi:cold shock CspA family protein/ribosome-associated translation inhibitor RaiA